MREINLNKDIELKLKKIYNNGSAEYKLELCCPTVVNLVNECPGQKIGFKINKCFNHNGNIYHVDSSKNVIIEYTNLTTNIYQQLTGIVVDNYVFVELNTSTTSIVNKLCIKSICINVIPKCFTAGLINSKINLLSLASLECIYIDIRSLVEKCFLEFDRETLSQAAKEYRPDSIYGDLATTIYENIDNIDYEEIINAIIKYVLDNSNNYTLEDLLELLKLFKEL